MGCFWQCANYFWHIAKCCQITGGFLQKGFSLLAVCHCGWQHAKFFKIPGRNIHIYQIQFGQYTHNMGNGRPPWAAVESLYISQESVGQLVSQLLYACSAKTVGPRSFIIGMEVGLDGGPLNFYMSRSKVKGQGQIGRKMCHFGTNLGHRSQVHMYVSDQDQ